MQGKELSLKFALLLAGAALCTRPVAAADSPSTDELLRLVQEGQARQSVFSELERRSDPRIAPIAEKAARKYEHPTRLLLRKADPSGKSERINEQAGAFRDEAELQYYAKRLAAKNGDRQSFDEIAAQLSSPDGQTRKRALDAMPVIGDKAGIAAIFRSNIIDDDGTPDPVDDNYAYRYSDNAIKILKWLIPQDELPAALKKHHDRKVGRSALKQWWLKNRKKYERLEFGSRAP